MSKTKRRPRSGKSCGLPPQLRNTPRLNLFVLAFTFTLVPIETLCGSHDTHQAVVFHYSRALHSRGKLYIHIFCVIIYRLFCFIDSILYSGW